MCSAYFDIEKHAFSTRKGQVELPILYYNTGSVFASFLVKPEAAAGLLPAELEPVSVWPGKVLVTVAFFQYVDSSVGPYHEMGLAIAARPSATRGFRDTAAWHPRSSVLPVMYVLDLPVTTGIANAAGREIWGYPKIVVPIDFQLRGNEVDCSVRSAPEGMPLCRLHGIAGAGMVMPAPNLMTYTVLKGQLLRTTIDMRGRMCHAGGGSVRLEVGQGRHPLVQHLRKLGLDGQSPLAVQSGIGLQAILPQGVEVV